MRSRLTVLWFAFVIVAGVGGIAIIVASLAGLSIPPALRLVSLITTGVASAMVAVEALRRLRR